MRIRDRLRSFKPLELMAVSRPIDNGAGVTAAPTAHCQTRGCARTAAASARRLPFAVRLDERIRGAVASRGRSREPDMQVIMVS